MPASFLDGLKSVGDAITGIFSFAKQKDAEKNSAPMQANADSLTDQQIIDKATQNVANSDIDSVRKDDAA